MPNEKPRFHIVRDVSPEQSPAEPKLAAPAPLRSQPKSKPTASPRPSSKHKQRIAELADQLAVQMHRAHEVLQGGDPTAAIAGWEAQTEVLLQEALGHGHTYSHRFQMAMINNDKAAGVRAAYTVLQAIYEDAVAGRLRPTGF